CLAAAMSWISFVPTEHYHAAHYSINENFVPVDFLAFVSSALVAAFDSASDTRFAAVGKLVQNITALFQSLPPDSVADVLDPLRPGLAV
ncbi:hypothetical protein Q0N58_14800, partial [Staphylococcus aureus]|nr:hypothetical protein [Staphylococcus aureus]